MGGDHGRCGLLLEVIVGGVACCGSNHGRCILLWEVIVGGVYSCVR